MVTNCPSVGCESIPTAAPLAKPGKRHAAGHGPASGGHQPNTWLSRRFAADHTEGAALLAPLGHHWFFPSFGKDLWEPSRPTCCSVL